MGQYISYLRVSTDRQGRSGLGLKSQKTLIKSFLKNQSVLKEFVEIESGQNNKRPKLMEALNLCKKEKAILIVAKLDRLTRDLHFLTSLEKAKIKFILCDMPHASPLTIHILSAVAQFERELISKRTKAALKELKKKGVKLGAHNPKVKKGLDKYRKNKVQNKGDKNKQKTLKKVDTFCLKYQSVFKLLNEQNLNLREMKEKLNLLGLKTRRGKEWNECQVSRMKRRFKLN